MSDLKKKVHDLYDEWASGNYTESFDDFLIGLLDAGVGRECLRKTMGEGRILPCPCGKIPTNIGLYFAMGEPPVKWAYAVPDCCGEWNIEFRTEYSQDVAHLESLATEAWNNAPRKEYLLAALKENSDE